MGMEHNNGKNWGGCLGTKYPGVVLGGLPEPQTDFKY